MKYKFLIYSALFHLLFIDLVSDFYKSDPVAKKINIEFRAAKMSGAEGPKLVVVHERPQKRASTIEDSSAPKQESHLIHLANGSVISREQLGLQVRYPRLARLRGEQGRVVIQVNQKFGIKTAKVSETSGFARLDEAALASVLEAIAHGMSGLSEVLSISFIFKLSEN